MGFIASAKGEFVRVALDRLTHGDTGSSILGIVAAGALASGASFGDLFSSDQTKQAHAAGLLAGGVVVALWGWKIGRKDSGSKTPGANSRKET